jgi:hypothetical protein
VVSQSGLPVWGFKIPKVVQSHIPSSANHQESSADARRSLCFLHKVTEQDNVGIDVCHDIGGSEPLGFAKEIVQEYGARGMADYFRAMPQTQFPAQLLDALLVPEEDDFRPWGQKSPAFDCISLSDSDMAFECLWSSENGQHRFILY